MRPSGRDELTCTVQYLGGKYWLTPMQSTLSKPRSCVPARQTGLSHINWASSLVYILGSALLTAFADDNPLRVGPSSAA